VPDGIVSPGEEEFGNPAGGHRAAEERFEDDADGVEDAAGIGPLAFLALGGRRRGRVGEDRADGEPQHQRQEFLLDEVGRAAQCR